MLKTPRWLGDKHGTRAPHHVTVFYGMEYGVWQRTSHIWASGHLGNKGKRETVAGVFYIPTTPYSQAAVDQKSFIGRTVQ